MTKKTEVTYVCDKCGRESHNKDFNDGSSCGSFELKLEGHVGGRSFDGSWGGVSHSISMDLCFDCGTKLMQNL